MPREVEVHKVRETGDRKLPIFAELDRLADRIRVEAYNLFAGRGAGDGHALDDWLAAEKQLCWPSAELDEQDGHYTLKVALAGSEPNDITVTATPRELIVRAERERRSESGNGGVRWSEFRSNDAFRRVGVPGTLDVEKTTATFENGLLQVVAPKAAPETRQKAESNVAVSAGAAGKPAAK
jgi:HSP20 family protein